MAPGQLEVAVFNGDSVVREAVEVLLQAAGYRVRPLREATTGDLGELLADSRLLLVAPELSAGSMRLLIDSLSSLSAFAKIAVLELVPEGAEPNLRGVRVVPWPCSMEQLKLAIDTALYDEC